MSVRNANMQDLEAIRDLLQQLEYGDTGHFLKEKMQQIISDENSTLLVFEENDKVLGFIAIDFITQLAVNGDFARITYFCIDNNHRNKGIGKQLESAALQLAVERKCSLVEVHCHERRKEAHQFYNAMGYVESPKYLIKKLK